MSARAWQLLTQSSQDRITGVSPDSLICHRFILQGPEPLKPNLPADENRLDGCQSASPLLEACLLGKPVTSQRRVGKGDGSGWGWLNS